ncbi:MAG: rRNA maturation RNase YbeY [Gammaproteobacteria bacterium]|nr:rRNA maturation RNase YbeY [Gammaproteobacteria bacterium]
MALNRKTELVVEAPVSGSKSEVWVEFGEPAENLDVVQVQAWVRAACAGRTGAVYVRFVGEEEGRSLNSRFRQIVQATNVLAFPANEKGILGDIAICIPLAIEEAVDQGKSLIAHLAHLVVHGALHLCGYDHEDSKEAEKMEAKETQILLKLGFDNPYTPHG